MYDGFIKTAAATPEIRVADCQYNSDAIIALINEAKQQSVKLLVFPELCITGYTCHDLFLQPTLIAAAMEGLRTVLDATRGSDMAVIVGCPINVGGSRNCNCAVVMQNGEVLGIVPKKFLPNYNEFYEARQFSPASEDDETIVIFEKKVPFGLNLHFRCLDFPAFSFGVEICEDLWAPNPPSVELALGGAAIIANLSASNETIGKDEYRKSLVVGQSARLICGYIFASAGEGESTQDLVFGGHRIIAENGVTLADSGLYTTGLTVSEIDLLRLYTDRMRNSSFTPDGVELREIYFQTQISETPLTRKIESLPFVPQSADEKDKRCSDILAMQAHGLAKRLSHTSAKSAVVGISGGLDSCLALLVCAEAMKLLNRPNSDIITVTMPCFGTTERTKSNAERLCQILGTTLRVIDISASVRQHFADISHSEDVHNTTYENAQARERTQVLMDIANEENGLVIGTGDLSELALGWATYNGDHMSMYGVNSSVPKTLVRHIVRYYAQTTDNSELRDVLMSIYETPVSPELLPAENGEISQITEDLVGPYELHDFFLYYGIRWGFSPKKVYRLARYAFAEAYTADTVLKWLKIFYKRFFAQQFKRSCLPDGVKVGSVSLSPRGDWRMPSDASAAAWLKELEGLKI